MGMGLGEKRRWGGRGSGKVNTGVLHKLRPLLFRVPREDTSNLLPGRYKPYLENAMFTITNFHLSS